RGLGALPRSRLEELLQQPALLLQLQELLLCEGGTYWERLSGSLPELATLALPQGPDPHRFSANGPALSPLSSPRARPRKRRAWRVAAVLAAALLVLWTGVAAVIELQRSRAEIATLTADLTMTKQELAALPKLPDDGPRLAMVCRTLAALSDLPP